MELLAGGFRPRYHSRQMWLEIGPPHCPDVLNFRAMAAKIHT